MAEILLDGVAHSYDGGRTYALKPLHLTWEDGKAYAILGPSGCGKTTLLNIMSGILRPTHGRVVIDGMDATDVPTTERNIAQVFQFPVLYETMTVGQNLAFPLRNRKVDRALVDQRVKSVAELLGLAEQLDAKPQRLRADLQQIVSLGRGLVRQDVAAILFDEPLTVIDPNFKWTLRSKLKELHRQIGHTLIYVTHDQTEALTFADEVIVLNDGEVVQRGTPSELFLEPAHEFVGHFIGSPGMSFLAAEIDGGAVRVGDQLLGRATAESPELDDGPVRVGVRPEFVRVSDDLSSRGLTATITASDRRGAFTLVHGEVGGQLLIAKMPPATHLERGASACFQLDPDRTLLFREGRRCGRTAADLTDHAKELR